MHKMPRYGPGAAAQAAMAQHELDAHVKLPPHPFVVAMHRCWQDDRSVYLLLELCACTLFDALFLHGDRNYRLPEASAKMYVASVALALRHLHRAGFVFRDLKLENVLVREGGSVALCDFGSASSELTGAGPLPRQERLRLQDRLERFTTPMYRAPEILLGDKVYGSAVDIWSFGCIFAEWLQHCVLRPVVPAL